MEAIEIEVSGTAAVVTKKQPVVSGTVGLPVVFHFDEGWEELDKIAVFRANGKIMDQVCTQTETIAPWELLTKPGCHLWCGVYGCHKDCQVQLPTVWVDLGQIEPGAEPSGDVSAEPTLPVWQQLSQDVENALDEILKIQEDIFSRGVM